MKKLSLIIVILHAIVTIGCSTSTSIQRGVMNNSVFYSSSPPLEVRVSPDLNYEGMLNEKRKVSAAESEALLNLDTETHLFIKSRKRQIEKAVIIYIKNISSSFFPDIYRRKENVLARGIEKFKGKPYDSLVLAGTPGSNEELSILSDKGYSLPNCYMMKAIGRRFGVQADIIADIRFIEALDENNFPCESWLNSDPITTEQKEFLQWFERRFQASVKILK